MDLLKLPRWNEKTGGCKKTPGTNNRLFRTKAVCISSLSSPVWFDDLCNPSHTAIFEPHFYTMGMGL